jgi:monoterpene epsilon-lactone hydrolase
MILPMASLQTGLFDRLMRRLHLLGGDGADLPTLRRRIARTAPIVLPWTGVRATPVQAGGPPGEWVTPKQAGADGVLLYLHGGAWAIGSPRSHRALVANLARAAGIRALSLAYRLAPEYPYPAALDDCVDAYDWLLASGIEPGRIVVAGDSAGGNLALALMLRLRDSGSPLPGGAVLLSPVTDLELSGASHANRKALDPVFAGADLRTFITAYAGGHDPREPYLSPLLADLHGLPPLLIHVGDHEILLDDAVRLGEHARAAGVEERTVVWPGMMHVFQTFAPWLPEARRANREIAAFIRSRVGVPG